MKSRKIKDILKIITVPLICIIIIIFTMIYNHFTQKIIKVIPNLYELCGILIFINISFAILNIIDYKKGKL